MNVGVIGTGTMGRNHVRIYREDERYTQENIIEKFTIASLQALNNLRLCEEIGRSNGIF
jgi:homoserine dehydrogenase